MLAGVKTDAALAAAEGVLSEGVRGSGVARATAVVRGAEARYRNWSSAESALLNWTWATSPSSAAASSVDVSSRAESPTRVAEAGGVSGVLGCLPS